MGTVDPISILKGDPLDGADLPLAVRKQIGSATMVIYEEIRDLPKDQQIRVLIAVAVLVGRADDLVEGLTGKVRV